MISFLKKNKLTIAYILSRLFGPVPILCLLWFTAAYKSGIGFWRALWVYPLIFVVCVALPTAITTLILVKRKIDLDWTNRQQRLTAFLIYLAFWFPASALVLFLTNATMFHLYLLLLFIAIILLFITSFLKYKISLHAAGAFVTFCAVNLFTHNRYPWLFLFLIPIIWSRLVLKKHTFKQLILGILIPASLILIALLVFGWPKIPK